MMIPAQKALLILAMGIVSPVAAQQSEQENCSVIAGDPEALVSVPTLHVIEQTASGDFVLPPDTPLNVKAVQCSRSSIIPARDDYKVVLAGFPLIIAAKDGRIAAMEVSEHRVQFRTLEGEFSDDEIPTITDYLNYAQPLMDVQDDGT